MTIILEILWKKIYLLHISIHEIESKTKRRSFSTGGNLTSSPPKSQKSETHRTFLEGGSNYLGTGGYPDRLPLNFYTLTTATNTRLRDRERDMRPSKSGVHVRFSSVQDRSNKNLASPGGVDLTERPFRCHHIPVQPPTQMDPDGGKGVGPGTGASRYGPLSVQRTQSNPEMEFCPVCLARKECEILLKRTYSKVWHVKQFNFIIFLWEKEHDCLFLDLNFTSQNSMIFDCDTWKTILNLFKPDWKLGELKLCQKSGLIYFRFPPLGEKNSLRGNLQKRTWFLTIGALNWYSPL